jgi:Tfp pilus assembly protein PilO
VNPIQSLRPLRTEIAAIAVPVSMAVAMLALFTVPNYMRALSWEREASVYRARASEAAARQDGLQALQLEVDRLRRELAQRGRTLPGSPDQGELLAALGQSGERKGITSSESKSGRLAVVNVPGLSGGKASRRPVDAQMSGQFDALFGALSGAEGLPALVAVRTVEFTRSPSVQDPNAPIEAHFTFDEYFTERAAAAPSSGKDGE